jgi:26S proteasome regulatory subunit N2
MVFALGAGKLFDIHKAAEFEETILGRIPQSFMPIFTSRPFPFLLRH